MTGWDKVRREKAVRAARAVRYEVDRGFVRMTIAQRSLIRQLAREHNVDVGDLDGIDRVGAAELVEWLKRQ